MPTPNRKCPSCGSGRLECDGLSIWGAGRPILFGTRLMNKRKLLAYACLDCGHVSLYLDDLDEDGDAYAVDKASDD
ncbi:MAG TPA: hypothetical protein VM695_01040 [Phycisphaerae bacterium]|nr:hypothetical protein [Phycisphaerae bacterium]